MTDIAITLSAVGKRYRQTQGQGLLIKKLAHLGRRASARDVWALRDIDLDIPRGE
jgi:ABC-type polysaccharide/polyol phosphate transport system ATPase subunit